jgi:hypothetical protein
MERSSFPNFAGYPLDSPQRIREIPQLLEQFQITEATRRGFQTESVRKISSPSCQGHNQFSGMVVRRPRPDNLEMQ